ncbi:metal-dependent transcriptional regulator [Candidatus Pyrohabitans sp.]
MESRHRRRYRKRVEELLEEIWTLKEEDRTSVSDLLEFTKEEDAGQVLDHMVERGLISIGDDEIRLTAEGEAIAREIVRRHRLAERLLSDVFEVSEGEVETHACEFEHLLSPEVTDSVCTFLGHPPTCPHGKPIPRGECCAKFRRELSPLVLPLPELEVGMQAKIVFIAPRSHVTLDRLGSLGIIPGSILKLHQKKPTFVIRIGETDLAIDEEVARQIYVKRMVA